jgi:hypothetical protein
MEEQAPAEPLRGLPLMIEWPIGGHQKPLGHVLKDDLI